MVKESYADGSACRSSCSIVNLFSPQARSEMYQMSVRDRKLWCALDKAGQHERMFASQKLRLLIYKVWPVVEKVSLTLTSVAHN
mmetsp:Transcript_50812/g.135599  ORF Transcript_50812/g.135599 Transcript_50812/m.135599 type:complete len:84 (-) Transcript_50812:434-685(-)